MFSDWWLNLALDGAVLALALAFDRLLPEPPAAVHPVVLVGRAVRLLERCAPRTPPVAFAYGCLVVVLVVAATAVLAWLAMTGLSALGPVAYVLGGAVLLRTAFTVTGLSSAAAVTRRALAAGDLEDARASLRSLVSRDPTSLTSPEVAASAIESVAENTTDSFIAPWLAFAILGVPGAVAYRAVNTLDSMLGYRGPYEYFGKASAGLDDLLNLVPARLGAFLLLASGATMRLPVARACRGMLADRRLTASPNAGWTMGAAAHLLGVELEKRGHYRLGAGLRLPGAGDIARAAGLADRTAILGALVALAILAARHAVVA